MQDIHTIGVGAGGRLFGGGERRIRPLHHQGHGGGQLKCPRCESVNTKFCYYNNYNLSQPRHFCKSCRRYWTKGGVLRNVPVGGGCRKAKRSMKNASDPRKILEENSQSSSDSSSLTASVAAPEIVSEMVPSSQRETSPSAEQLLVTSLPPKILDFSQDGVNPILDTITSFSDPSDGCEIGSFTSMMTSSSNPLMGFDFGYRLQLHSDGKVVENLSSTNQQWTHQQETTMTTMPEELKMQDIMGGFLDSTAQMDLSSRHHGGLETLDHELFDLTGTVDQTYWNQPQWNDVNDHALYLP